MSRRSRVLVVVIGALAMSLASASPALADSSQPGGPPDRGSHTYCYGDGFTWTGTADGAMGWLEDQTLVDTTFHSSCTTRTDVVWNLESIDGVFGMAICYERTEDGGYCDQYDVYLNSGLIVDADHPSSQRRKTACHELGHTVGVRHYANESYPGADTSHSCLRSGPVPTADQAWHTRFGPHHRLYHINPHFAGTPIPV